MNEQLYYVCWHLPGEADRSAQRSAIPLPREEAQRLAEEKNANTRYLAWLEPAPAPHSASMETGTAEQIIRREG